MSTSSYTLDLLADEINKRLKTIPDLVLQKDLPSKLGDFYNNVGYITLNDIPSWAQSSTKPAYEASEVGAEAAGAVNTHNQDANAHADIRQLIANVNKLDSTTLDEINKLIVAAKTEGITGKVNTSDIVDRLDSMATNQPLSANQGRKLNESYIDLSGKYDILNGNYITLSGKYDILNGNYTTLSGKYDALNKWAGGDNGLTTKMYSSQHYTVIQPTGDNPTPLVIKSTDTKSYILYNGNNANLGYIGFSAANTPVVLDPDGNYKGDIIHSGNIESHAATETETWTFYLEGSSTPITKAVYIAK